MFYHCRSAGRLVGTAKVVLMTQPRTIVSPTASQILLSPRSAIVRPSSNPHRSIFTMNKGDDRQQVDAIFQQKHSLRATLRKSLKNMDPIQRSEEVYAGDLLLIHIVLEAPWFRSSKSLCAYISCAALREVGTSRILSEILCNPAKARRLLNAIGDSYSSFSSQEGNTQIGKMLYVPRVEDRNSNMKMLKISSVNDLITNSMNILEPALVDCDGNQREDVMQASDPVDLFILPVTIDTFLKNYKELAKERKWKQPLLVALSYSLQIMEEGVIAVTPNDVQVDALVSPAGFIPISPAALERG